MTAEDTDRILLLMDPNGLSQVFDRYADSTTKSPMTEDPGSSEPYLDKTTFAQAMQELNVVHSSSSSSSSSDMERLMERFDYNQDGKMERHEFLSALKVPSELEQVLAGLPILKALARCLLQRQQQQLQEQTENNSTINSDPISALASMGQDVIRDAVQDASDIICQVLEKSCAKLVQYQERQNEREAEQQQLGNASEQKYCFQFHGGDLQDYNQGLSTRIGIPHTNVLLGMEREHVWSKTADEVFTTSNYNITTTSKIEYRLAMTGGNFYRDVAQRNNAPEIAMLSDEEQKLVAEGGAPRNGTGPVREFKTIQAYQELKVVQQAQLTYAEIIGIVLYTGPLYKPWNTTLRAGSGEYRTSVHVVASAMKKIQQSGYNLRPGMLLYRGLSGGQLPTRIFHPDPNSNGQTGMTEFGIQSTTSDIQVALQYSGVTRGFMATVVETRVSQVDSGAYISELSQYPMEREYVYPPGSYMQAEGEGRMELTEYGLVKVVPMRINTNGRTMTVEEVMGERRTNVLKTYELVVREIAFELSNTYEQDERVLALNRNCFPILKTAYIPDYLVGLIEWGTETLEPSLHNTGMVQVIVQQYLPQWWKDNVEGFNEEWFNGDLNYKNILKQIVDLKRQALGVMEYFIDGMNDLTWSGLFGAARSYYSLDTLDTMRNDHLKSRLADLKSQRDGDLDEIKSIARQILQKEGYLSQAVDELHNDDTGETPLMHEAQNGNANLVSLLIDAGVDVNVQDHTKQTALFYAAKEGQMLVVKALIEQGHCEVDTEAVSKDTAFQIACKGGHLPVVEYLVKTANAKVNPRTVCHAAGEGHADIVDFLVNQCSVDPNTSIPIGGATQEEMKEMMPDKMKNCQYVLEKNFELAEGSTSVEDYLQKATQLAAENAGKSSSGQEAAITFTVGHTTPLAAEAEKGEGENVMVDNPQTYFTFDAIQTDKATPLHFAATKDESEVASVLCQHELIDLNARAGNDGITPLMLAAAKGSLNVVQVLLKATTMQEQRERKYDGTTLLMMAIRGGNETVVDLILQSAADDDLVNEANDGGWTPLMFASFRDGDNVEMVRMLVEAGADVNTETESGVSALLCALNGRNAAITRFLLSDCDANAHQVDSEERGVLDYCESSDEILQLLLEIAPELQHLIDEKEAGPYEIKITSSTGLWNSFEIAVMNCILSGTLDGVKMIVDQSNSTDVLHAVCDDGMTGLMFASQKGYLEIAQYLLEKGDVNWTVRDKKGRTALDFAQEASDNPDLENIQGLLAMGGGRFEKVIALLESLPSEYTGSFDETKRNKGGMTYTLDYTQQQQAAYPPPDTTSMYLEGLMYSCKGGSLDGVQVLIQNGGRALANEQGEDGSTSLHWSAEGGHLDTVRYLLIDCKADLSIRRHDGKSVLDVAKHALETNEEQVTLLGGRLQELISFLEEKGCQ